jgi:hypothetical protein
MLETLFESAFELMGLLDAEGRLLALHRQALAAIRRDHPGLPVVLCSGYSEQEIRGDLGGVFLAKPCTRHTLKAALLRALTKGS